MKRNYDIVASFYDRLARLVFGRAQLRATLYLLTAIPAETKILIVGGGTGWILEELAKVHPSGLTITYVDASAKMVQLSKKRNIAGNKVSFITSRIEEVALASYDVVITPFLLDNFKQGMAEKICLGIYGSLQKGGLWLYCDFENNRALWQRVMLKIVYTFFRACCGIEAESLPDMRVCFPEGRYKLYGTKTFYSGFIVSRVYEKL